MTTTQPDDITLDDFRAIVSSVGLPLDQAELEHLLPQYQQLQRQLQAIHDPDLDLGLPADVFTPDWD